MKDVLEQVREKKPLVQCITNFVTVNDCANMILATGGSPSMASDVREVAEAVAGADALVCNMGTIAETDSMIVGGKAANALGKPVILDPVAVGGTAFRRAAAEQLLREVRFSVIRGNASEIRYLAGEQTRGSGVDVEDKDAVTAENYREAVLMVREAAKKLGCVIVLSGELDLVSDGCKTIALRNGCATMARITGSGCMLTALIGAFCGAMPALWAAVAATAAMGICGEHAEKKRIANGTGNASFRTDLIDAMFLLTEQQLKEEVRYEIFEG